MTKLLLALMLALPLLVACQPEQPPVPTAPPPEVDIAKPLKHKITEWEEFTGRFEAVERVEVRARVTGYLLEKRFRDGQMVKKGDVLFDIDARPFEYEVRRAKAQYTLAQKAYQRGDELRRRQAIPQEDFDRRLQEMQVAEAALEQARLDLAFTEVKAPLDGKISQGFVDVGNLVRENETVLTRIVTVDPIHFEFEGSQGQLLKFLRLDRAGERPSSDRAPNPIVIRLQDEDSFTHWGRMDFVDNIIDPGTGTIFGRALVQNKGAIIYPGMFGRARLIGRSDHAALMLPERAINTDQARKYVYTVNEQDKAVRTYVEPGEILDNGLVLIENGLTGDERVVINGIQRIRSADQPVTPVETPLEWTDLETMPDLESVPSLQVISADREANAVVAPISKTPID